MKSWKNVRSVLPAFDISKAIALPAGHEKLSIAYEWPGETVNSPKSLETEGALLNVVDLVAVSES